MCAAGIDLDKQNDNGATCLMYAASAGKAEVVACLLANGADLTLRSLDDYSALDMASTRACLCLLRSGARRVPAHPVADDAARANSAQPASQRL